MDGRAFVVAAWEFNRNTATSVVFIEVFAFPIRNITLILKRRAKATREAILSARAFAHLVCRELSDCDPPMCFKLFVSLRRCQDPLESQDPTQRIGGA